MKSKRQTDQIDEVTGEVVLDPNIGPLTKVHRPHQIRHIDDLEWEMLRFEGQWSKMMFHPSSDDPTVPNAGVVRYDPGSSHPLHNHYFGQVWYILEGEFDIGGTVCRPGTMVFHPDPHYEQELKTSTGGLILFVQYVGPSTKVGPIYDGRFNMTERNPLDEERVDR